MIARPYIRTARRSSKDAERLVFHVAGVRLERAGGNFSYVSSKQRASSGHVFNSQWGAGKR